MRRAPFLAWLALAGLAAPARAAADAKEADAILGTWRGESLCVKAEWNAACNDERIEYVIVPAKEAGAVTLQARKWVGDAYQPMGDLDFRYDAAAHEWFAELTNSRGQIRWSYALQGDSMTGKLLILPDRRVARNVRAHRQGPS